MIRNTYRRSVAMLSASALTIGILGVGIGVGTSGAGATGTPGITATTVTIGATVPLSGIAAGYKTVSAAANAVFKYVNSKGGVNGRKINYIRLDDCYGIFAYGCSNGGLTTLQQTTTLVTTNHVFATVGALGTATQDTVRNFLNTNHVPQLFVNSGSKDWNLPTTYPNLFGFQSSYKVEGKIFAKYIKAHYAGQKVGFIGQGDDFGTDGYAGLTAGTGLSVAAADKLLYSATNFAGAAAAINTQIGLFKSHGVKVVVLDAVPPFVAAALNDAHTATYSPKYVISSVGSNPLSVNSIYEAGAVTTNVFPATSDSANIWNKWLHKVLALDTADKASNWPTLTTTSILDANWQYGAAFAVAFVEALKTLGATPTRTGIVNALKTAVFANPGVLPLHYTSVNHQGYLGGLIAIIGPASGAIAPKTFTEPSHVIYTTTDSPTSAISTSTIYTVKAIPAWLS